MKFKSSKLRLIIAMLIVLGGVLYVFGTKAILSKTEDQDLHRELWKKELSSFEHWILWKKGTEPPYTGDLLNNKDKGVYVSAACGEPVFKSIHKFDSKTGWPSFWEKYSDDAVRMVPDYSGGVIRQEVVSAICGEHLGHVFEDGPAPTGLRYCINSAALDFIPDSEVESKLAD